jgi:NAD(P)-dependent dehydrogenase (short-subunit alcohol dehydrogenase family)
MQAENRVALLTGGTGALGSAVGLDLMAAGHRVAAPYRSEEEFVHLVQRAASSKESLFGIKADLTRGEDLERAAASVIERWGRIDHLIAVAGGFAAGKSYETDERTWDHLFNLNLRAVYLAVRAVVPHMIRQNYGRIVTVSSSSILGGGGAGMAAYVISKTAARQLSEILAEELKAYDIHVHCVLPGTMDTPANRAAMPKADFSKWVKTEEVARVIRTLLSEDLRAVRSVAVPVLS